MACGPASERAAANARHNCGSCNSIAESRRRRPTPGRGFSWQAGDRAGAPAAAGARPVRIAQRLAMYIVISMPNRNSIACGVSHFMNDLLDGQVRVPWCLRTAPRAESGDIMKLRLMIFMSGDARDGNVAGRGPGTMPRMKLRTRLNLVVAGLSAAFVARADRRRDPEHPLTPCARKSRRPTGWPSSSSAGWPRSTRHRRPRARAAVPAAARPGARQRGLSAVPRRRGALPLAARDLQGGPRGARLVRAPVRAAMPRTSFRCAAACSWWSRRSRRAPCSMPGTTSCALSIAASSCWSSSTGSPSGSSRGCSSPSPSSPTGSSGMQRGDLGIPAAAAGAAPRRQSSAPPSTAWRRRSRTRFGPRRKARDAEAGSRSGARWPRSADQRVEEERRLIAHELHDEFGQSVTAIRSLALAIATQGGARDRGDGRGRAADLGRGGAPLRCDARPDSAARAAVARHARSRRRPSRIWCATGSGATPPSTSTLRQRAARRISAEP